MRLLLIAAAAFALVTSARLVTDSRAQSDSAACNTIRRALSEKAEPNYDAALESFDRVVKGCLDPEIRAGALLQIGHIHLEKWPPDLPKAKAAADLAMAGTNLNLPTAPHGYILLGLIALADGRSFERALTEFNRVDSNVMGSPDAYAEAKYRIGEAHRLNHQFELALRTLQQVPLAYPKTPWAAKALLSAASCQARLGKHVEAMESLQQVRRDFPRLDEATAALAYNTILHRLHFRGSPQELVPVTTAKKAYSEGVALALDRLGRLLVGYKEGLATVAADTGDEIPSAGMPRSASSDVTAVGTWGPAVAMASKSTVIVSGARPPLAFLVPDSDAIDIRAIVTDWRGEWLVADEKTASVGRYSATGAYLRPFAEKMRVARMAQNDLDDVALLDMTPKTVRVLDRNRANQIDIPKKLAAQYELDSPIDVAFDVLGNLYVLDDDKRQIVVFDSGLTFRTIVKVPETLIKKPKALAIDSRGHIFVLGREGQLVGFR